MISAPALEIQTWVYNADSTEQNREVAFRDKVGRWWKEKISYLFICLHEGVPSNLTGFEILTILENSLLSSSKECVVPQIIHTHHMEGYQYWKFQVGGGHKSQSFQKKVWTSWMKGEQTKSPFMGRVWVFSGTTPGVKNPWPPQKYRGKHLFVGNRLLARSWKLRFQEACLPQIFNGLGFLTSFFFFKKWASNFPLSW